MHVHLKLDNHVYIADAQTVDIQKDPQTIYIDECLPTGVKFAYKQDAKLFVDGNDENPFNTNSKLETK